MSFLSSVNYLSKVISYIKNVSGMSKDDLSNSDLEPDYFEIKIINKDGLDVTGCYNISYRNTD